MCKTLHNHDHGSLEQSKSLHSSWPQCQLETQRPKLQEQQGLWVNSGVPGSPAHSRPPQCLPHSPPPAWWARITRHLLSGQIRTKCRNQPARLLQGTVLCGRLCRGAAASRSQSRSQQPQPCGSAGVGPSLAPPLGPALCLLTPERTGRGGPGWSRLHSLGA